MRTATYPLRGQVAVERHEDGTATVYTMVAPNTFLTDARISAEDVQALAAALLAAEPDVDDRDPELADALGAATSLPRSELLPEVRRLTVQRARWQDLIDSPTTATNGTEQPETALQRFAGELWRLASGLADRGIPLRDGEAQGAAVDTALAELDRRQTIIDRLCRAAELVGLDNVPQNRSSAGVPEVEQATQRRCFIEEPHPGHRWYADGAPLVCGGQV